MIGKKNKAFWLFWKLCWYVVTPLILSVLTFWSLATFKPLEDHPTWATALGWLVLMSGMLWVPGCFIFQLLKVKKSDGESSFMQKLFGPNSKWGPYLEKHRVGSKYDTEIHMGGITNKAYPN